MVSPRVRPLFEMHVQAAASDSLGRLKDKLKGSKCPCTGEIAGNHIHLNICKPEQKIWSPHLNLEVTESEHEGQGDGESETNIRGHFGPRADVWTFVMALYAISVCGVIFGSIYAFSQQSLGSPVTGWKLVIASAILGAVVYGLSLTGQRLAQDQMRILLNYVRDAVGRENTTDVVVK